VRLWAAEIGGADLHARCAERIGLILHATLCPQSKAKCRHVAYQLPKADDPSAGITSAHFMK
jgi:hypothetical protein